MRDDGTMKVGILGAGAVGLSLAARLSKVVQVYAVARTRHVARIRDEGFSLSGIWGEESCTFRCGENLPENEQFDYFLITAKSVDTRQICDQFADVIAGREVVSLQNGIGNEEIIAEYTDRVIGGMIITGFEWRGEASVHVSVEGGPIRLGRYPEGMDRAVFELLNVLRSAGLNVEGSQNIRSDLWGKALYNCALNPLGALMGVNYGALSDPHAWEIITGIVSEIFSVASAEGVDLPWESPEAYLDYLEGTQLPATAGHHSSMLQDLRRGRITEIGFLNGAIMERGQAHAIPVPFNTILTNLIRFKESLGGAAE
jgi:2-dehydropantoate 2-reductase